MQTQTGTEQKVASEVAEVKTTFKEWALGLAAVGAMLWPFFAQ